MLDDIAEGRVAFIGEVSNNEGFSWGFSVDFDCGKAAVVTEAKRAGIFEYGRLFTGEMTKMNSRAGRFFLGFFFGFFR